MTESYNLAIILGPFEAFPALDVQSRELAFQSAWVAGNSKPPHSSRDQRQANLVMRVKGFPPQPALDTSFQPRNGASGRRLTEKVGSFIY